MPATHAMNAGKEKLETRARLFKTQLRSPRVGVNF